MSRALSHESEEAARATVEAIVARARAAQVRFAEGADQERQDRAALAVAWALIEPSRNRALSRLAVESTGLGNVADKVTKNHRKTLGLVRDLEGVRTAGIIREDAERGITEIARPIGVVGAVVPSTNPSATPTNNIVNALKCGNAIVLSPSPAGARVCEALLAHVHAELDKVGIERDLVQMVPAPSSKVKTQRLMECVDLIVVTGSGDNVRRAYRSGTPAIGVGAGNATVIVDASADTDAAAARIAASKTFDNATSCSSENVVIVLESVHDDFVAALERHGGRLLGASDAARLKGALFTAGGLERRMIAKDLPDFLDVAGIELDRPEGARFVVLAGEGIGPDHPESGEKLSLALTLFVARDFEDAQRIAAEVLAHQGAGHSVGLHSADESQAIELGLRLPSCRVIVNQAHCFATGGAFDNGLPFSLSMGCGSWGGNSIDANLHWRHFMNITRVVRPIPPDEPTVESLFAAHWRRAGR